MKIALIVPMAEEAELYRRQFSNTEKEMFGSIVFEHFSVHQNEVFLGLSGIGKVNAAMNLTSLLTVEKIDLILMTGSAGALQQNIHQGDLILPNKFMYHDVHNTGAGNYVEGQIPQEPAGYVLHSIARNKMVAYLQQKEVAFKSGLIVTGDSFISSVEQKQNISQLFPTALGVEMEGAAFAQVAHHFGIPLVALRVISDNGDGKAGLDFDTFVKKAGAKAARLLIGYLRKLE